LKIGVGARSISMGEASTAAVDDVSSIFWNPAGLVLIKDSQLSAMHAEWFSDIRYEWVGFAQPLSSRAAIAADVSYLYMGSIPRTIESATEKYEQDGTFSPADIAGRLALSIKLRNLLIGGSFQRLQSRIDFRDVTKEEIGDKIAQSFSIDAGCIYNFQKISGLSFGGCLQNIGSQTSAFFREKESMPFSINIGTVYKTRLSGASAASVRRDSQKTKETEDGDQDQKQAEPEQFGMLVLAVDVKIPVDNSISAHAGLEYRFANGVLIRGGYNTVTGLDFPSGLSAGLGYDNNEYQLDYAFVPYGNLGNTHRMSLTVRF